ncbi:hypothetical protein [Flavobacterium sp. NRK1]|uniref:hypothetical protein n=1 Tax=Flavobacterium sp. NRK1 TaxID=2954929 RepID=UPI002092E079|nr:hypothetical protein [Flavobacterium sp. NRK1]MCO6148699.1 hypothetical protein [Flavobacterium sp. NRK1]
MDIGYLKVKIDIKTEYDEYKKKYNYTKKEIKKEEVKKVFEGFKEFFKNDGGFKFKENEHSVAAEYKDHAIKLDMDIYKNIESDDYNLHGTIETYDREIFDISVIGICNSDHTLQPAFASEEERMVHDTRYYKDFLEDKISYTFQYKIEGREELYTTMQQLMLAL